jgi:hypothetical protein
MRLESTYSFAAQSLPIELCDVKLRKDSRPLDLPRSINLIFRLPEPKIALHRISKLAAFEACAPSIHDNDDVLQPTRNVVVPVSTELQTHHLAVRAAIPGMVLSKESFDPSFS